MNKPNVVIMFIDDLGIGDVSCYNPDSQIHTENIDKLASQGMKFTDGHATSALCTPSRYGLLTGRYNWRSVLKKLVYTDKIQGTDLSVLAKWQLYNMVGDVTERYNLYERYPEIAERLKHKLIKYIKDGRSTPGAAQLNYGGKNSWEEIASWMDQ